MFSTNHLGLRQGETNPVSKSVDGVAFTNATASSTVIESPLPPDVSFIRVQVVAQIAADNSGVS